MQAANMKTASCYVVFVEGRTGDFETVVDHQGIFIGVTHHSNSMMA
jgi:hypothetical protein